MSEQANDREMTLVEHLVELRDRLLRTLLVVLVIFCGLFYFANDIYSFVAAPLQKFLPENSTMIVAMATSAPSRSGSITRSPVRRVYRRQGSRRQDRQSVAATTVQSR